MAFLTASTNRGLLSFAITMGVSTSVMEGGSTRPVIVNHTAALINLPSSI